LKVPLQFLAPLRFAAAKPRFYGEVVQQPEVSENAILCYPCLMDFSAIVKPGLRAEKTEMVSGANTASAWGSGGLDVFATPAMIALMEMAALSAVDPLLPAGWSTVGIGLNVEHLAATPPGMEVRCTAELLEVEGRRLLFQVEAFDAAGKIGEGTHRRFIVENERFLKKAAEKTRSR
jgi:predicted thioesterase